MSSWDRPPAGTTVTEFFESWLPAAFAASGRPAPLAAPLVRASLSGAGGGAWDVQAREGAGDGGAEGVGTLQVTQATRDLPDVWLRQSVADFLSALSPEPDPDLPPLLPSGWSALDLLFLDPRDIELLRQVSGRVLVEVAGRRGRRWAFDVGFGKTGVSAGRARSTIRLDGATFEGLRNGSIPAIQPLLDGRLKIEGDRALAMQLLLLLGSRLARR
jgi:hypothetical protein